MHKKFDYLFWKLLLAPDTGDNGGNPGAEDNPGDNPDPDTQPEDNPELNLDYSNFDMKFDEKLDPSQITTKAYTDKAKELGISVEAAKELYGVMNTSLGQSVDDYEKGAADRCTAALKERWSTDYDKNNKALVRGFLRLTQDDENLKKELEETGQMNNPLFAEIVSRVGFYFKEEGQGGDDSTLSFDKSDPYGFAKNDKK